WLAGLGAYGKAVDEAHTQYKKVTDKVEKVKGASDQSELFDELVEKGMETLAGFASNLESKLT
ncbi:MAG: hypothetical protein VXY89_07775, partial [SAR324 cluster bacterium]|nr:hypothetical protein [SAR324 cluster bacterium]